MMNLTEQFWRIGLTLTIFVFCAGNILAQPKAQPKTVADYFMRLPQKHLPILEYYKNRRAAIKTLNVKNGYLEIKEKVFDGETIEAEVALFRQADGAAVIALAETSCGMDSCMGALTLLHYDGKNWTDVTENLLPEITDRMRVDAYNRIKSDLDEKLAVGDPLPETYYTLPRKGTTVTVLVGEMSAASTNQNWFYLKWNGATFAFSKTK